MNKNRNELYNSLRDCLYEESKVAFENAFREFGDDVYVAGYYHSGGWDDIFPIYNTRTWLAKCRINVDEDGEDDAEYFKIDCEWAPPHFHDLERYSCALPKSEEALTLLKPRLSSQGDEKQNAWKETLDCMVDVLCMLDKEQFFQQFVERDNFVLHIATYDEDYEPRYERIKRLNPTSAINRIKDDLEYAIAVRKRWEAEALRQLGISH